MSTDLVDEKTREMNLLNHNLRDIVRNLSAEYNTRNSIYNNQRNLLNKYDYYIGLQNQKLNQQLNKLDNIEANIATRDSLIGDNQTAFSYKEKTTHVLLVFFGIAALLVFAIVAYLGNKISLATLLFLMLAVIVIYGIYVAYVYNILFVKSFANFGAQEINELKKDVYDEGRRIESQINQYLNQNCECPIINDNDNNKNNKNKNIFPQFGKQTMAEDDDGFFYYDDTAPQDRIVPPIVPKISNKPPKSIDNNDFNIEWGVPAMMGMKSAPKGSVWPSGLPKGMVDKSCEQCSQTYGGSGRKEKKYWTTDL